MSKELRECPFCNGTHSINVINFITGDNFRRCDICGADAPEAKTPEEAAEKWNTRPAEDAKDKEIDSLVLCLAKVKSFCKTHHDYFAKREKTDIQELKLLDRYMIDWCDYIIETINSTCSGEGTNDD